MSRRSTSLVVVLALLGSLFLAGCPARKEPRSPTDLDAAFLDRA